MHATYVPLSLGTAVRKIRFYWIQLVIKLILILKCHPQVFACSKWELNGVYQPSNQTSQMLLIFNTSNMMTQRHNHYQNGHHLLRIRYFLHYLAIQLILVSDHYLRIRQFRILHLRTEIIQKKMLILIHIITPKQRLGDTISLKVELLNTTVVTIRQKVKLAEIHLKIFAKAETWSLLSQIQMTRSSISGISDVFKLTLVQPLLMSI